VGPRAQDAGEADALGAGEDASELEGDGEGFDTPSTIDATPPHDAVSTEAAGSFDGACVKQCANKKCGSDGCGGVCGTCGWASVCDESTWKCKSTCGNGVCEPDEGETNPTCPKDCKPAPGDGCSSTPGIPTCGGCPCEKAVCAQDGSCCTAMWDTACVSKCKLAGGCGGCTASCAGKKCGDDGCGKPCGECEAGYACNPSGQCEPNNTKCGNGTCDPGELPQFCPQDCK